MPMSQARSGCRPMHHFWGRRGSLGVYLRLESDVGAKARVVTGIDAESPEAALPLKIGQARDVHPDPAARIGFERCHQPGKGNIWGNPRVEMDVIQPSIDRDRSAALLLRDVSKHEDHLTPDRWSEARSPMLRGPDKMNPNSHDGSRQGTPCDTLTTSIPVAVIRLPDQGPILRLPIRAFAVEGAGVCPPPAGCPPPGSKPTWWGSNERTGPPFRMDPLRHALAQDCFVGPAGASSQ